MGEHAVVPPPLVDKKRGEPKMTPHLAALVKRVAELHTVVLRAHHYIKNLPFGGFTPLVVRRNWPTSARDLLI
jgi:hypothetical protein